MYTGTKCNMYIPLIYSQLHQILFFNSAVGRAQIYVNLYNIRAFFGLQIKENILTALTHTDTPTMLIVQTKQSQVFHSQKVLVKSNSQFFMVDEVPSSNIIAATPNNTPSSLHQDYYINHSQSTHFGTQTLSQNDTSLIIRQPLSASHWIDAYIDTVLTDAFANWSLDPTVGL